MIFTLALMIAIISLFQKTDERFFAACIYSMLNMAHIVMFYNMGGPYYYLSAGIFDLLIILWIGSISKVVSTSLRIQRICIAEILVNYFGFVLWANYHEPYWYNMAFIVLHALTIIVLLMKDASSDNRGYPVSSWRDHLRLIAGAGYHRI